MTGWLVGWLVEQLKSPVINTSLLEVEDLEP